jgi:hypothetical protein
MARAFSNFLKPSVMDASAPTSATLVDLAASDSVPGSALLNQKRLRRAADAVLAYDPAAESKAVVDEARSAVDGRASKTLAKQANYV